MASFHSSLLLFSSSTTPNPALSLPKLPKPIHSLHHLKFTQHNGLSTTTSIPDFRTSSDAPTVHLYSVLEAVSDRVELHHNVGEQRDNWNSLLFNSVNLVTLAATTMSAIATTAAAPSVLPLKLSSAILFCAATGLLIIMNKIQPSQLAEEQRNCTRLFRQLQTQIETTLALRDPTEFDVQDAIEKVLALDEAYPLPLLGKMIEKFPKKFEPAKWWPEPTKSRNNSPKSNAKINGWSPELEMEMREVAEVIKSKDSEDYMRLGSIALKINKWLAIVGPLLSGVAAAGSVLTSSGSKWGGIVAITAGSLCGVVNTLEHGGQVGMVVEMYRNCAGFFALMEETLEQKEMVEDGEIVEMKLALQLGRSLCELRDLTQKSCAAKLQGMAVDEFASKLF